MRQANFRESHSLISKYRHFRCFVNKFDLCGNPSALERLNTTISICQKSHLLFCSSKLSLEAAQIQMLKCRQVHMSSGRNLYFSSNPKFNNCRNCVWPQLKQNVHVCEVFFPFDQFLFIKYVFLSHFLAASK